MRKRTQWYVEYLYRGTVFGESSWSTPQDAPIVPENVEWTSGSYAFRICERTDGIDDDGMEYRGRVSKSGEFWHPDSKVTTFDNLRAINDPQDRILLDNMAANKWGAVIWTRFGDWPRPYNGDTMTILAHQEAA